MTQAPGPEEETALVSAAREVIPGPVRVAIVGTFLILLVGALYYARSFFLPLVLAMLLALTFAPVVRALVRRGIPAPVTAVALILGLAMALFAGTVLLSQPITTMVQDAPTVLDDVRARFAFLREPFAMLNDAGRELQSVLDGQSETDPDAPERVVIVQGGMLAWAAGTVADIGTTFGATLLLALFILAASEVLRHKLVRILPDLSGKKKSLRVLRDIENEVSRYLLTITAINAGLGICVGIAMWALGMSHPLLWAIGAMLLNYIPYVGGTLGLVLAGIVGLATFPSLFQAALPVLAYFIINMVESNFVTPTILGRRLELSTVAILIFLAFTTWMWGIVGTIIGVPVLVVIKVFCDNFPSLSGLAEFLSATIPAGSEDDAESNGSGPATGNANGSSTTAA